MISSSAEAALLTSRAPPFSGKWLFSASVKLNAKDPRLSLSGLANLDGIPALPVIHELIVSGQQNSSRFLGEELVEPGGVELEESRPAILFLAPFDVNIFQPTSILAVAYFCIEGVREVH